MVVVIFVYACTCFNPTIMSLCFSVSNSQWHVDAIILIFVYSSVSHMSLGSFDRHILFCLPSAVAANYSKAVSSFEETNNSFTSVD